MIARGVTLPAVYRILKEVFVEVAEQDFALGADRQTDSRISMLTGIHRKDVKALRDEARPDGAAAGLASSRSALTSLRWIPVSMLMRLSVWRSAPSAKSCSATSTNTSFRIR